ncbi:MAG: hypothetical protein K9M10_02125 [Candidatus Pacebacteria bacterium]|nr:hypothetical protein [Candidatus Paceibacterota bacterium]MCF7857261.1 hypothetical protein [Candidatus Paceibacterota bacterium]
MGFFERKKTRGRIRAKEKTSFARQIFFGVLKLLLVVLGIVLIWYVTRLEFFTINDVVIRGGETISHDEIRNSVNGELQGAYYLVVPKRFVYFYPHDRIVEVIEKTPRIHNIEITHPSNKTLEVSFEEFAPHALWCIYEKDDEPCYFIDVKGYAFATAPLLHGGTLVRHYVEDIDSIMSGSVIEEAVLSDIDNFIARANKELGFRITSLVHTGVGDIKFFVNGGGMIYVAKWKDLNQSFDNLQSVLSAKEFAHIKPGNFNYIDARFNNKIFVNEELDVHEESIEQNEE